MKILVLDEWLPSIENSGKSIRTFQLLAPLARKHQITYLAHIDGVAQQEQVQKMEAAGFEVVCVPRKMPYDSIPAILLGAIPALFDPNPISVTRHFSQDYANKIQELVKTHSFDLVHVEWTHYGVYGRFMPNLPQFACTHNVEYLSWTRFVKATTNPVKKLLGIHEGYKLKRFEKNYYSSIDYFSVVSEDDKRLVEKEFALDNVCVIPNGVAIAPYDEIPNAPIQDRLVYCGSMDAFINQDAVAYFIKEIFPLILKQKPNASFTVIGRDPPESLLKLANAKIQFTGRVKDIRVPLKEGMLEVVPLRIAGGSRLKILEAFAAKIPVLSTTIGAEGLECQDGQEIALADTPAQFAQECVALLDSPQRRSSLFEAGRKLVDEKYDWSRISPLVEQVWIETMDQFQRHHSRH